MSRFTKRLSLRPVPFSLVGPTSVNAPMLVEEGRTFGRAFILFGTLGMVPLFCVAVLLLVTSMIFSRQGHAAFGDAYLWTALISSAVAGMGLLLFGMHMRTNFRVLMPASSSELAICTKSWWNGTWKPIGKLPSKQCRMVKRPVVVPATGIIPAWHGHACIVEVGKTWFAVAAVNHEDELLAATNLLPSWLLDVPRVSESSVEVAADVLVNRGMLFGG